MEWRPVRGFEGEYLVSDSEDIKSVTRNVPNKSNRITVKERILKPWIDNWGYMNVCLFKNGKGTCKKVHRLIAEAFISPYHGEQVNHKDGIGMLWYFGNTASGQRAMTDQKSDLANGLDRVIRIYTVDGNIIAEYEGIIDIEGNDGGYVLFDYQGKRYTYYNCFVESIAEIGG